MNIMQPLPAPTAVPSLATSALLVSLHIGQWSASKKDKRASREVARNNRVADEKRARAYKTLMSSPKLDMIKSFVTRAHEVNRGMTLDWSASSGLRLCPTAIYAELMKTLTGLEAEFHRLVDDFGVDYNMLVVNQQAELGDMYDPADYPAWDKLRSKFYFRVDVMKIADPDGSDLRLDIAAETEAHIREHYQRAYERAMQQVTRGLWERLHALLVGGDDAVGLIQNLGKGGRIKGNKLDDAVAFVKILDDLNIMKDPQMAKASLELQKAFSDVRSADDVPPSSYERDRLHDDLRAVAAHIPSMDDW